MMRFAPLAVIAAALLVPQAAAAPQIPTVQITPAPAHVGDSVVFAGCGYTPGKDVAVFIYSPPGTDPSLPYYQGYFSTRVGAEGCYTTANFGLRVYVPPVAGTYETYTYYKYGSGIGVYGKGHKPILDVDFDVT